MFSLDSEIEEEEEESEFEVTDSDQSEDDERSQQIPSWSEDQVELLQSALSSYKFLPRTTTEKVYTELKERNSSSACTRRMVRSWFSSKEVMTSSARDRWEARLKKLAIYDPTYQYGYHSVVIIQSCMLLWDPYP